MDEQLYKKIEELELKVNEIYKITNAAKKMFLWSVVLSVLLFVIPLIILIIAWPTIIATFSGAYSGLL
ncbi:MAG: hypothetical protein HOC78_02205 [Candidatus Komeilibacteria bacterium]|jgi:hypothetical protein|nr:hypothetical protein [Candidatus Komeilibacteria bacterium]